MTRLLVIAAAASAAAAGLTDGAGFMIGSVFFIVAAVANHSRRTR